MYINSAYSAVVYLFLLSTEAAFDQGSEVTVDDSSLASLSAAITQMSQ